MTTPVYISAGYAFRDGYRAPANLDPDAAGMEFERFGVGRPGIDLRALVEHARDPKSALYAALTTDPDAMADKLHLIEVREVAGALHYRMVDPRTEDESVGPRAFMPTDEPNLWQRVEIRVRRAEQPTTPAEPMRIEVRPAPKPTPVYTAPRPVQTAPTVAAPPAPMAEAVLVPVVLTERQYRMREQLARMAETLADDPYFAGVVAAVRALM